MYHTHEVAHMPVGLSKWAGILRLIAQSCPMVVPTYSGMVMSPHAISWDATAVSIVAAWERAYVVCRHLYSIHDVRG